MMKLKRKTALLMIAVLLFTACPVNSFEAYADNEPIASETMTLTLYKGGHTHDGVVFEQAPVSNETELRALFTNGGSGYLTADITLAVAEPLKVRYKTVSLCLNGHTLDLNHQHIELAGNEGTVFNLYDCGDGKIIHGFGDEGGAVRIYDSDTRFNMYGGTITDCMAPYGGAVYCSGSFHMYGGTITGNTAFCYNMEEEGLGGGVYNDAMANSFHMHGGTITGNKAGSFGGGVYSCARADISFDGSCTVKDNASYKGRVTFSYGGTLSVDEESKVRDNVFFVSTQNDGRYTKAIDGRTVMDLPNAANSKEKLTEGSEIWVTYAVGDWRNITGLRIAGTFAASDDAVSEAKYFKSDVDALRVVSEGTEQISLVSRINEQPSEENGYTVGVETTGLTEAQGYSNPETELSYQWKETDARKEMLKDSDVTGVEEGLGTLYKDQNAVKATLIYSYEMKFNVPEGADYVTFTSDATELYKYNSDYSIEKHGTSYTYRWDTGVSEPFVYLGRSTEGVTEPFTINNVTFCYNANVETDIDDTDNALDTGAEENHDYFCTVTFKDGSTADSDQITYHEPELFEVSFNMMGHGEQVATQSVAYKRKVSKPEEPTEEGWKFRGWYTSEALSTIYDFATKVTGKLTLFAKWVSGDHTVTFDRTDIRSKTVKDGETIELPVISKDGYTFKGWYLEDDEDRVIYTGTYTVTEDVLFHALFTRQEKVGEKNLAIGAVSKKADTEVAGADPGEQALIDEILESRSVLKAPTNLAEGFKKSALEEVVAGTADAEELIFGLNVKLTEFSVSETVTSSEQSLTYHVKPWYRVKKSDGTVTGQQVVDNSELDGRKIGFCLAIPSVIDKRYAKVKHFDDDTGELVETIYAEVQTETVEGQTEKYVELAVSKFSTFSMVFVDSRPAAGDDPEPVEEEEEEEAEWYESYDNGWVLRQATGDWYYIENHRLKKGWHLDPEDKYWYYLDPVTGRMLIGWQYVGDKWYYLNMTTPEQTWFMEADGKFHYSTASTHKPYGSMYANEKTPDGYTVGADGAWIR